MDSNTRKAWGGKREGSGRKPGRDPEAKTCVVRVSPETKERLESLQDLVESLRAYKESALGDTSPRADKLKKMFDEFEDLYPWL